MAGIGCGVRHDKLPCVCFPMHASLHSMPARLTFPLTQARCPRQQQPLPFHPFRVRVRGASCGTHIQLSQELPKFAADCAAHDIQCQPVLPPVQATRGAANFTRASYPRPSPKRPPHLTVMGFSRMFTVLQASSSASNYRASTVRNLIPTGVASESSSRLARLMCL